MFTLTKEALVSAKNVPAGKYLFDISSYEEGLSKAGDSTNYTFALTIADGPYKGKTINKLWNEKALDKAIPDAVNSLASLLDACGQSGSDGGVFDGNRLVGKQVYGFVTVKKSEKGSTFNDIESFAPAA